MLVGPCTANVNPDRRSLPRRWSGGTTRHQFVITVNTRVSGPRHDLAMALTLYVAAGSVTRIASAAGGKAAALHQRFSFGMLAGDHRRHCPFRTALLHSVAKKEKLPNETKNKSIFSARLLAVGGGRQQLFVRSAAPGAHMPAMRLSLAKDCRCWSDRKWWRLIIDTLVRWDRLTLNP